MKQTLRSGQTHCVVRYAELMIRRIGLRRNDGSAVVALPVVIPTGKRTARNTPQQQRGIWLHALLQHLTE